jgi:hypothetical protein
VGGLALKGREGHGDGDHHKGPGQLPDNFRNVFEDSTYSTWWNEFFDHLVDGVDGRRVYRANTMHLIGAVIL